MQPITVNHYARIFSHILKTSPDLHTVPRHSLTVGNKITVNDVGGVLCISSALQVFVGWPIRPTAPKADAYAAYSDIKYST